MSNSAPSSAATSGVAVGAAQPRPIRFVTNHDGPYAKRRRINSACLTCRRKKTRCSGERPVCGTCIQNKHECAGYGPEGDPQTHADATREKKSARKESLPSTNVPLRKQKLEPVAVAAPQPMRPPLNQSTSNASLNSDTSIHPTISKQDDNPAFSGFSLSTRNRMPYFRYFGPTAIMPGFRQMVVKVRGKQHSTGHTTSDPAIESSPGLPPSVGSPPTIEARTPVEIPVYDTSTMSPSPLITHLCKLFFVHLGCTFPFLQRERFMRDLEEKQVDAILVDAVCALAARFSTHPLLTGSVDHHKDIEGEPSKVQPSEYGQAFAQRAKSAIPDAFPCPSVAVVQAALILGYDEFGANRDSGLWMYLGVSIRMAQDLGMQTLEGLKYEGRDGPTPNSVFTDPDGGNRPHQSITGQYKRKGSAHAEEEQRAVERERLDTFWSLFFLDRVISSGTGRPVTLRDKDIEISFPSMADVDPASGYPLPFPPLIRIIHLYGRVTDLLNSVKEKSHMTEDLRKQLDTLEYHLTEIYQGLSPRLHFNALNFQQYVKINQGTNFLLLHCWFHTLIVLLHQPTLLKTFEGNVEHLSSNSRELSMSSAKTVADILAFTDLIDAKTGVGNPFTSQPIYIAACAFLKETALHSASSQPHSRFSSPGTNQSVEPRADEKPSLDHMRFDRVPNVSNSDRLSVAHEHDKQAAKHTLLASAANQNYQRCYRALKALETYWAGVKYILTVLEQKAKGVGEPLLYTREEMESALEVPTTDPSFTSPGWRRKLSWGTYLTAQDLEVDPTKVPTAIKRTRTPTIPGSPMPLATQAIGWSLTGTMNSPSTNVAVMYTADSNTRDNKSLPDSTQPSIASVLSNASTGHRVKFEPNSTSAGSASSLPISTPTHPSFDPTNMPPPPNNNTNNYNTMGTPDPVLVSEADLLLNLHSPFSASSPSATRASLAAAYQSHRPSIVNPVVSATPMPNPQDFSPTAFAQYPNPSDNFGDMVIDTQDVDMSLLGPEMMPWDLEYLPHDVLFYGDGGFNVGGDGDREAG
ncbi:hypothetical protein BU24DRAFT_466904 [Aaosphaeria arxii CBS 175.79]|uniref:Zn(2)-C6 fungal-type domain-containing protein n=1 Tax=Aaosphaeria arxii CBS 175.79 TaxID=1450172 RepID=A0A6A5XDH0_9PLEO|nr:uncharacterized protein BU24DRAFT_466904 [Aaosphaeria arxii CBS 175.79]KAF2011175.1 hypothetical protein BU24DRAFT_466904 [Aaosphaeria arxii CBS 175.79]